MTSLSTQFVQFRDGLTGLFDPDELLNHISLEANTHPGILSWLGHSILWICSHSQENIYKIQKTALHGLELLKQDYLGGENFTFLEKAFYRSLHIFVSNSTSLLHRLDFHNVIRNTIACAFIQEKNIVDLMIDACFLGRLDVVSEILSTIGYNRDIIFRGRASDGITLLHVACQNNHDIIVNNLIRLFHNYLDLLFKTSVDGVTPFFLACQNGHLLVVEAFIRNIGDEIHYLFQQHLFNKTTPLIAAICHNHLLTAKFLIDAANNNLGLLSLQDQNGNTALHVACCQGNFELADLLLSALKNDVDALFLENNEGVTAFYFACQKGHLEIVRLFLNITTNREQLFQKADNGLSPLHVACFSGHLAVIQEQTKIADVDIALFSLQASQRHRTHGATPIQFAYHAEHRALVMELLRAYVHRKNLIFHADNEGMTLLHIACSKGDLDLVRELIAIAEGDLDLLFKLNNEGASAFYIACQNNHERIARLLLRAANSQHHLFFIPIHLGIMPFTIAVINEHECILRFFFRNFLHNLEWCLRADNEGNCLLSLVSPENIPNHLYPINFKPVIDAINTKQNKNPHIVTDACHFLFSTDNTTLGHVVNLAGTRERFITFLASKLTEMMGSSNLDLSFVIQACHLLYSDYNYTYEALRSINFNLNAFKLFTLAYLESIVERHVDVATAYKLTLFLLNERIQNALGLYNEHILVQRVLFIRAACDTVSEPSNPYTLYQKLKQEYENGPYLEPIFDSGVDTTTLISLQTLRERGCHFPFTFADLQNRITLKQVDALFETLKERLILLEPELAEKTWNFLVQVVPIESSQDWDVITPLKHNLLYEDRIVLQLLNRTGPPAEEIPNELAYLDAIFKWILTIATEITDEKPISDQEKELLNFASFVQECSTGQSDAISLYYSEKVPSSLKVRNRENQEPIDRLVDHAIQDVLKQLLEDSTFIIKLIAPETSSQQSHISRYLKNRYAKDIGLQHKPVFDLGTPTLPDKLLKANPQKVLGLILQELSTEYWTRKISEKIMTTFNSFYTQDKDRIDLSLYEALTRFLDREQIPISSCISLEEDPNRPQLMREGALVLLKSKGYFP